ncbi:MAG: sugar phosphate isomerase/epimerase [Candidatus Thorarchaeota archaeon]|nr:sugar phosphate isomerase/epimerase [Candidatus Thorarchaeota archaeon]
MFMRNPSRRGYHVVYDESIQGALEYAYKNDWTAIVPDLGVPTFFPNRFSASSRTKLRKLSEELSVEISLHAPGDDVSLFTAYPSIRSAVIDHFKEIIQFARDINSSPTNVVVHSGRPPSFRQSGQESDIFVDQWRDFYATTLRDNLSELLKCGGTDISIVLENHQWTDLVHDAIDELVSNGLQLCFDIPKMFFPKVNARDLDVFNRHKEAISVIHVHDQDEVTGSHQVVGQGIIDFEPAIRFLSGIPRRALYVFEVRPREKADESLSGFSQMLSKYNVSL